MLKDRHVRRNGRRHTPDVHLAERPQRAADRRLTVPAPHHQLADQVVVELADLVAGLVAAVEAHPVAVGHLQRVDPPGRRKELPAGRILGVDPHLDGMPRNRHVLLGELQRLAGRHPKLLLDQVQARHQLGHRVLHLQAGVHLQVEELAVLVQELDGAGVLVAAALRHLHRCLAHGGPHVVGQARRGCLLDQLLMPTLRRAVPVAQVDDVAVGVGQYLDLDVAGRLQVALHVDLVTGEVGEGLPLGRLDCVLDGRLVGHHLHAPAAAAVGRLDGDRIAVLGAEGTHLARVGDELRRAGNAQHADRFGGQPGADLVAHHLDGLRWRADERHAPLGDRPGEVGVLGEEPVAGVHGVGAAALDDAHDRLDVQVALGGRLSPQGVGLVSQAGMQGVAVQVGVDGDRGHPLLTAGPDDPDGDLASIRDQNLVEHGHMVT